MTYGDIQSVSAPKVTKNTTFAMEEEDASRFLHAPDVKTLVGCRDHAMLHTYFTTACRSAAIANATVGDLEQTATDWYLHVIEKGKKERRMNLLEAAASILAWIDRAGIDLNDHDHPLFPAIAPDKKTITRRPLSGRAVLKNVKKYGEMVGLKLVFYS